MTNQHENSDKKNVNKRKKKVYTLSRSRSPLAKDYRDKKSSSNSSRSRRAIQIKLNAPLKSSAAQIPIIKPNKLVAKAFNDDSDEEVEEMPAECRMRMRNIGKNTITSSGPNSFGKTKQGFVDSKKIFEKQLKSISSDD
ncbi:unnamed protein product [Diamesa hyperborea]